MSSSAVSMDPNDLVSRVSTALRSAGYGDMHVEYAGEDKFGYPVYEIGDGNNLLSLCTWDSGTDEELSIKEVIQDALYIAKELKVM